uniref:Uncharacterized protein n=2 Tax=Hemiselmis andersenii TaxID=464988 RepID=A0A7S1GUP2_HEMAN
METWDEEEEEEDQQAATHESVNQSVSLVGALGVSRPLDKTMRIRVNEHRSQLLYSDTDFYPRGHKERAMTSIEQQGAERRAELYRRKLLGEEKLVGQHVRPRVGLEVLYSFDAVDNFQRPSNENKGVIMSVDDDLAMCSVRWKDGEEEYCCTGYKDRYFLRVQNQTKQRKMSDARAWAMDAILSPRFTAGERAMWRMKSNFRDHRPQQTRRREGKKIHREVSVQVRALARQWEKERLKEEENEVERRKVEKLMKLQSAAQANSKARKEEKQFREDLEIARRAGERDRLNQLGKRAEGSKEALARQMLRDQVAEGKAVSLSEAQHVEVETLMSGFKFPKLALQTFDEGLPTWMLRPTAPRITAALQGGGR